jgi:threonine dehydratase
VFAAAGARSISAVPGRTIAAAMHMTWKRMNIPIEPSAAVPFSAIPEKKLDAGAGRSGRSFRGGNIDLDGLPW